MSDYTERKLEYYGQPLKFLKAYKAITIILLVFLLIGTAFSVFNVSSWDLALAGSLLIIAAGLLSIFSLPLLDKFSFFSTVLFVALLLIRVIGNIIPLIAGALSITTIATDGDVLSQGMSMFSNSLSFVFSGVSWFTSGLLILLVIPLVLFTIQIIKHKKLFFSSLKQLKKEYQE